MTPRRWAGPLDFRPDAHATTAPPDAPESPGMRENTPGDQAGPDSGASPDATTPPEVRAETWVGSNFPRPHLRRAP